MSYNLHLGLVSFFAPSMHLKLKWTNVVKIQLIERLGTQNVKLRDQKNTVKTVREMRLEVFNFGLVTFLTSILIYIEIYLCWEICNFLLILNRFLTDISAYIYCHQGCVADRSACILESTCSKRMYQHKCGTVNFL